MDVERLGGRDGLAHRQMMHLLGQLAALEGDAPQQATGGGRGDRRALLKLLCAVAVGFHELHRLPDVAH